MQGFKNILCVLEGGGARQLTLASAGAQNKQVNRAGVDASPRATFGLLAPDALEN